MAFLAGALATLGLVAGAAVVVSLLARRRFARHSSAFTCRVRRAGKGRRRWRRWRRWPLGRSGARWIHDVLVLQSRPLGWSVTPLAARIARGAALRPVASAEVRGLGRRPWAVVLTTDDGVSLEVAVAETDRDRLVGPYLTAALSGLPSAPHEHGV